MGGFDSIALNKSAYAEAARVLSLGGQLLELMRLYEEGSPTQQHLIKEGQAAATWLDYVALLEGMGFIIQRWEVLNTGWGKTRPNDGLLLGNEA